MLLLLLLLLLLLGHSPQFEQGAAQKL